METTTTTNKFPWLVGICGSIGHGKTTLANLFVSKCNYKPINFADKIKQFCELMGFEHDQVYGTQQQKLEINATWNISFRKFAQVIGTDVFRNYLPTLLPEMKLNEESFWERCTRIELEKMKANNVNVVIGDVRFDTEKKMIEELGGVVIMIVRSTNYDEKDINQPLHESEKMEFSSSPNVILINEGSLEDLKRTFCLMCSTYKQTDSKCVRFYQC